MKSFLMLCLSILKKIAFLTTIVLITSFLLHLHRVHSRPLLTPHKNHRVAPVAVRVVAKSKWKHLRVLATAYVVNARESGKCPTYTSRTASGTIATKGTIAVDPRVIPMGSRMIVPHYGYGRARDTGGAIVGRRIDLAVLSCHAAYSWGVRSVLIAYQKP